MPQDSNLIWIDLEMTGLNVERDYIIEIATIVTDSNLRILAEGPVIAIHQTDEILAGMDDWNQQHHGQSGLIDRVQCSQINEMEAQQATLNFLSEYVAAGKSPMCGNSICQDRRFLYKHMPKLERYFHYRHVDVTTVKILAQHWKPIILDGLTKITTHTALQDIRDSIDELRYYRQHLFSL